MAVAAALAGGFAVSRVVGDEDASSPAGAELRDDPGPVHVHGLGVNPADRSLFIATHTGLYRVADGETEATRVTDRRQDTMGFAVVGPNRFLGSGHPDLRDELPPLLGLIRSNDAGRTWQPVSLLGRADFHVLRAVGSRVYGFDASNDRLLMSVDGGRTWTPRSRPAPLLDLVPRPGDVRHLFASGTGGLYVSRDEGRSWRAAGGEPSLLAWPSRRALYRVDGSGRVHISADGGSTWSRLGDVGGTPAAFTAESARELYVGLHDGTIKRSLDGGRSWTVRAAP